MESCDLNNTVLRSLFLIATYRASFEDFITLYNLFKTYNIRIPFRKEFEKDFSFDDPNTKSTESQDFSINKIGSSSIKISSSEGDLKYCVDEEYLYQLWNEENTIKKFSLKLTNSHEPGDIVLNKKAKYNTQGMTIIGDYLYTLKIVENTILFVYNKHNLEFVTSLLKNSEEEVKEEKDKTLREVVELNKGYLDSLNAYKIFTDGEHLCIFWIKAKTIDYFNPKTYKLVKSIGISYDLEGETEENKGEESKFLKDCEENNDIGQSHCAINQEYFFLTLKSKIYILEIKGDHAKRIDKVLDLEGNFPVFSNNKMEFWKAVEEINFTSFKIQGISEAVETEEVEELNLKSEYKGKPYIKAENILNLLEVTKYGDKIEDEIKKIDSEVTQGEFEHLKLHLQLFRGEYFPVISHEYFNQLFKAIQRPDLEKTEIKRLAKLTYYSLKSLTKMSISLQKMLDSEEKAAVIEKFSQEHKEEKNLKIYLPIEEIIEKGLGAYNDIERYQIVAKLMRDIYCINIDIKEDNDQTNTQKYKVKYENLMKSFQTIFDYFTERSIKMFQELKHRGKEILDLYEKTKKEESKDASEDLTLELESYTKEQIKLYDEFYIRNKSLDHYKMLIACYASCSTYTMSSRLNHI